LVEHRFGSHREAGLPGPDPVDPDRMGDLVVESLAEIRRATYEH